MGNRNIRGLNFIQQIRRLTNIQGNLGNYYKNATMAGDPSSSGNSCAITKEYVKEILENHGFGDVDIKLDNQGYYDDDKFAILDKQFKADKEGYIKSKAAALDRIRSANSGGGVVEEPVYPTSEDTHDWLIGLGAGGLGFGSVNQV